MCSCVPADFCISVKGQNSSFMRQGLLWRKNGERLGGVSLNRTNLRGRETVGVIQSAKIAYRRKFEFPKTSNFASGKRLIRQDYSRCEYSSQTPVRKTVSMTGLLYVIISKNILFNFIVFLFHN